MSHCRTKNRAKDEPFTFPATVVVDTREQSPFAFASLRTDVREGRRPLIVSTVRGTLKSGDYSLAGFETQVAVERKSIEDLFNTLGQGRGRFQRELARLNDQAYLFAAVVVEAGWDEIIAAPPERSMLRPKTVHRSVISWQMRFPRIHWWMCPNRAFAEVTTFRLLERFWKEQQRDQAGAVLTAPFASKAQ